MVLIFSALAWGASIFGVFLSWPVAVDMLQGLGAGPMNHDPMLDYWLRMAAGAFTLVGVLFLVLAIKPHTHRAIIPWFGGLMLVEGGVLLVHGIRLSLPPLPFIPDTLACFGGGTAIFYLSGQAFAEARGVTSGLNTDC